MSRITRWRSRCPDTVRTRQEAALNPGVGGEETEPNSSRIYLLRRSGPTAFVIKEEGKKQNLRVWISDPHTCTCMVYQTEKDLCKHICWCLLKILRLKPDDSLSYQLGLVPREISNLLHADEKNAFTIREVKQRTVLPQIHNDASDSGQARRRATKSDSCPICLENLLERREPVTHCRYGCGNLVHISCMLVWAKHAGVKESGNEPMLSCPLCRGSFGSKKHLKEESRNAPRRLRLQRHRIKVQQINKSLQQDKEVKRSKNLAKVKKIYGFLPPINTSLQAAKEKSEGQGNEKKSPEESKIIDKDVLENVPRIHIHKSHRLLVKGQQCCICLSPYKQGEFVRALPFCAHFFHSTCLRRWTTEHGGWLAICPLDGSRIAPDSPDLQVTRERTQQGEPKNISVMFSKPSIAHGNSTSEDIVRSLSSSFTVKRLSISTRRPCKSPVNTSETKRGGVYILDRGVVEKEVEQEKVEEEKPDTRRQRRAQRAPRPTPPLLVQLSLRNASEESSTVSSSENAVAETIADEGEEPRGTKRGCRRRKQPPKYPGYIPVAAVDLAAVGPCLSVKALPVQPLRTHDGTASSRSPSSLSQRTPQKPEELRCHRYQDPPQPLLWSHHRAKHSHQQYGAEPHDLVTPSEVSQGKILQCSRMRLSPKSPPVKGQWDDLIFWDPIDGSGSESGGSRGREESYKCDVST